MVLATTTTKDAIPIPTLPDTRDVPRDFLAAFGAVDGKMIYPCTSATRPTGGARFSGRLIYETDTKAYGWWDGAAWNMYDTQVQSLTSASTVTTNATQMTNYTATRRWLRQGRSLRVQWNFVAGTGFTPGTGIMQLTMPSGISIDITVLSMPWGMWMAGTSTGSYQGPVVSYYNVSDGTMVTCDYYPSAGGGGFVTTTPGSNIPGTFVATNFLRAQAHVFVA